MYLKATILTILGWFIGLLLIRAMGLCILHELRRGSSR